MGEINSRYDTIALLANYGTESEKLAVSFRLSEEDIEISVIEDDGFLPDGIHSVYGAFLGDYGAGRTRGPLYFNEVPVPKFWEIKGNNSSAAIYDHTHERGRIFYTKDSSLRLVRIVDWLDDRGVVRFSDHYNKYGKNYARTIFNKKGQRVNKSYFSPEGKEVIVENFVTGDIILNEDEVVRVFHNKTDFVIYYLQKFGMDQSRIVYNSLSVPFFVSQKLDQRGCKDILFWQEERRDDIPGNMQMILDGQSHTRKIMVQRRAAFEKFMELGVSDNIMEARGYVYPFIKENRGQKEALICTNSDQIEGIEALVQELTDVRFNIAALTEMSSKLLGLGKYNNVALYPNVKRTVLKELFENADYYLDINREREIVDAVYKAYLHKHVIVGFADTLHNRDYIATSAIFQAGDVKGMSDMIRKCMESEEYRAERIRMQLVETMAERELNLP